MSKPVGRPPTTTPSGDRVELKTINITVPRNLWIFLKDNNIPRSKLFVEVVTMLKSGEINPCCYKSDRSENEIGVYCPHCSTPPDRFTYIYVNNCPKCGKRFKINDRLDSSDYGKYQECCK